MNRVFHKAISYNTVSETGNELDVRTPESDGRNRIDDPYNEPGFYNNEPMSPSFFGSSQ